MVPKEPPFWSPESLASSIQQRAYVKSKFGSCALSADKSRHSNVSTWSSRTIRVSWGHCPLVSRSFFSGYIRLFCAGGQAEKQRAHAATRICPLNLRQSANALLGNENQKFRMKIFYLKIDLLCWLFSYFHLHFKFNHEANRARICFTNWWFTTREPLCSTSTLQSKDS